MKALLLIAPFERYMREMRCQAPLEKVMVDCSRPPISLACLAGILEEEGFECKIKDCPAQQLNWEDIACEVKSFKPDVIMTQFTLRTFQNDLRICQLAKSIDKNIRTMGFGGVSAGAADLMNKNEALDIFLYEEPECALREIASGAPADNIPGIAYRQEGRIYDNAGAKLIEDLDRLPFADRSLLDNRLYCRPDTNAVQTELKVSRGCPGECTFCLAPVVNGRKLLSRSAKNISDEIERCVADLNIRDFFFRSDTFTWNKDWVLSLCEEIIKRKLSIRWCCNSRADLITPDILAKMKEAGCWLISIGIESGSQEILDKIKKNITLDDCRRAVKLCREAGIRTYLNFMIGFPWDDARTISETIRFAHELNGDMAEFPLVMPFPGTALHDLIAQKGLFDNQETAADRLPLPTLYLAREEVLRFWQRAVMYYYCRPGFAFKTLYRAARENTLFNYLRSGIKKIANIL